MRENVLHTLIWAVLHAMKYQPCLYVLRLSHFFFFLKALSDLCMEDEEDEEAEH